MYKTSILYILFTILSYHSFSQSYEVTDQQNINEFQLIILKQDWYDLDLGHEFKKAFSILSSIPSIA